MTDKAIVERVAADFYPIELRAIAASLVQCDPDAVCEVAGVVVVHTGDGSHTIRIFADGDRDAAGVARVLRHAADHIHGGCKRCRRANRRESRHAAG